MPSPRWPSAVIRSRSVTPPSEQELAIAARAEDRRRQDAGDPPSERGDDIGDFLADPRLDGDIADDSLLDAAASGLELGLDQRDEIGREARKPQCRGQPQLQRDEAHVDDDEIRRLRETPRIESA